MEQLLSTVDWCIQSVYFLFCAFIGRPSCWRHVSLASNNYGSSRQSLCWWSFSSDHSFSSRLSVQATQGTSFPPIVFPKVVLNSNCLLKSCNLFSLVFIFTCLRLDLWHAVVLNLKHVLVSSFANLLCPTTTKLLFLVCFVHIRGYFLCDSFSRIIFCYLLNLL